MGGVVFMVLEGFLANAAIASSNSDFWSLVRVVLPGVCSCSIVFFQLGPTIWGD